MELGGPIDLGAEFFRWYSEEAVRIHGRWMQAPAGGSRLLTIKKPVGPCLFVTPWNFPLAIPTWKMFPALVCGNACVFKPAEDVPHTGHLLVEIMLEAGLPPEVIQLVHGLGEDVGAPLGRLADAPDARDLPNDWLPWLDEMRAAAHGKLRGPHAVPSHVLGTSFGPASQSMISS